MVNTITAPTIGDDLLAIISGLALSPLASSLRTFRAFRHNYPVKAINAL